MTTYNDTSVKQIVHNVCTKTELDAATSVSADELYYVDMELTANKVMLTDDDGNPATSTVSATPTVLNITYADGTTGTLSVLGTVA